jgi:hypothetical protein
MALISPVLSSVCFTHLTSPKLSELAFSRKVLTFVGWRCYKTPWRAPCNAEHFTVLRLGNIAGVVKIWGRLVCGKASQLNGLVATEPCGRVIGAVEGKNLWESFEGLAGRCTHRGQLSASAAVSKPLNHPFLFKMLSLLALKVLCVQICIVQSVHLLAAYEILDQVSVILWLIVGERFPRWSNISHLRIEVNIKNIIIMQ